MIFYSMLIEKSLDDNFLFKLKHSPRQIPPLKTHISLLEKLWEEVEVGVKVEVEAEVEAEVEETEEEIGDVECAVCSVQ